MGDFTTNYRTPLRPFAAAKTKVLFTTLPPTDPSEEADRGLVVIQGGGAKVIDLNHSHSANASRSVMKETQRTVDNVRIKNPDNPDQHVDVQRPASVNMQMDSKGNVTSIRASTGDANVTITYAPQPAQDNVEVLEEGIVIKNPEYEG